MWGQSLIMCGIQHVFRPAVSRGVNRVSHSESRTLPVILPEQAMLINVVYVI